MTKEFYEVYELSFDSEHNLLKLVSKPEVYDRYVDSFDAILLGFGQALKKYVPKNLLLDNQHLDYIYPVDKQAQVAQVWYEAFVFCQLQKFANVTPTSFVVYLSLEQIMDYLIVLNPEFDIHFFRYQIQAEKWIGINYSDEYQ